MKEALKYKYIRDLQKSLDDNILNRFNEEMLEKFIEWINR